jgi:hypothetical protein
LIMRAVDEHLHGYQTDPKERIDLFAVHGNRFILHLVKCFADTVTV